MRFEFKKLVRCAYPAKQYIAVISFKSWLFTYTQIKRLAFAIINYGGNILDLWWRNLTDEYQRKVIVFLEGKIAVFTVCFKQFCAFDNRLPPDTAGYTQVSFPYRSYRDACCSNHRSIRCTQHKTHSIRQNCLNDQGKCKPRTCNWFRDLFARAQPL